MPREKVQTNLKLSTERATALDVASAIEGKDKASIVEEALRLREGLMGTDYHQILEQALAYRSSADPDECLRAIEALRDAIPGATPGGSTFVEAVLAKIRLRARSSR